MTPLWQRMLDDMKLRNLALSTRKICVSSVAGFSPYHGRSLDQLNSALISRPGPSRGGAERQQCWRYRRRPGHHLE